MIADTNFLLRSLDPENKTHGARARARIEVARDSGEPIAVLVPTVIEVAYVLQANISEYGYDVQRTAETLKLIIEEPAFTVAEQDVLGRAVEMFIRQPSADLHDCYLAACAEVDSTKMLSFDRDLKKLGLAELP